MYASCAASLAVLTLPLASSMCSSTLSSPTSVRNALARAHSCGTASANAAPLANRYAPMTETPMMEAQGRRAHELCAYRREVLAVQLAAPLFFLDRNHLNETWCCCLPPGSMCTSCAACSEIQSLLRRTALCLLLLFPPVAATGDKPSCTRSIDAQACQSGRRQAQCRLAGVCVPDSAFSPGTGDSRRRCPTSPQAVRPAVRHPIKNPDA